MKKQLIAFFLISAAGMLCAQGRLLKHLDFESTAGIQPWPEDSVLEIDTEDFKQGKGSLIFTPDNNCVAYFYQPMIAGHKYRITCWVKMEKKPIARCGISLAFAKKNGANDSAGRKMFSFADLVPGDNQWHECKVEFTAPPETHRAQVQLAMYRTNAVINVDDLTLRDLSQEPPADAPKGSIVSKGKLLKSLDFASAEGLMKWPEKAVFNLQKPDAPDGRHAIIFTPEDSYSAYFYQIMPPGEYSIEFDWKAAETPIKRCALMVFFTSPGGKRGDLGQQSFPLSSLGEADGAWKHAAVRFKVPEGVGKTSQVMLAMYRTNTVIQIADLKIFQEESDRQ
ncbi:MAG: hypothetical protein J5858_03535 [Lentisphaeria bacterium]|nr:hypothetical protein [Lentisphaeria bacterium]